MQYYSNIAYGRKSNSDINIYDFNYEIKEYLSKEKSIKLPPMLEQITTDENELVLLFESSAFKYRTTCKYIVEDLVTLNINKII